jgi:hypothetical protein
LENKVLGLATYIDHLAASRQERFNTVLSFQVWMEGKGFHRDVGGTHGGSPIMRKLTRHGLSRAGHQTIIAIGRRGGNPPTFTDLQAVVSCITRADAETHYKPVFGVMWLSNQIVAARHVRLVASTASNLAFARHEMNRDKIEAEVRSMLDEL